MQLTLASIKDENNNRARTIINNCDHLVYCGGHDFETACYISNLANVPLEKVIDMPLDKQFILVRGQKPIYAERLAPDAMVIDTDSEASSPTSNPVVEPVVLSNVPKSLLLLTGAVDKRYYRFCFAYDVDDNDVIYATIRLPLKCVDVKEKKCTITLGAPEEIYTCHIGDMQGYTHITAQMIAATYRQNRSRYIALMKKRPTRINPQHKDDN